MSYKMTLGKKVWLLCVRSLKRSWVRSWKGHGARLLKLYLTARSNHVTTFVAGSSTQTTIMASGLVRKKISYWSWSTKSVMPGKRLLMPLTLNMPTTRTWVIALAAPQKTSRTNGSSSVGRTATWDRRAPGHLRKPWSSSMWYVLLLRLNWLKRVSKWLFSIRMEIWPQVKLARSTKRDSS